MQNGEAVKKFVTTMEVLKEKIFEVYQSSEDKRKILEVLALKSQEYKRQMHELDSVMYIMKNNILVLEELLESFSTNGIVQPIRSINMLLMTIFYLQEDSNLTNEEISQIMGMVIYFNYEYINESSNLVMENVDEISLLVDYYQKDGSFKYNRNLTLFKETWQKIGDDNNFSIIRSFVNQLNNYNENFNLKGDIPTNEKIMLRQLVI